MILLVSNVSFVNDVSMSTNSSVSERLSQIFAFHMAASASAPGLVHALPSYPILILVAVGAIHAKCTVTCPRV
jgi:hypothetical protein